LSKNPTWTHMQALDLTEDNIGDKGAEYLCKNTIWTNLQTLNLFGNNIVEKGVEFLSLKATWNHCLYAYEYYLLNGTRILKQHPSTN